ncbi:MAG: relaxase domain-containing protein [Phycisphaerales bacterium]|nr:relaxase domain-containing protein [Phycisphaerales bacterium]
MLRINQFTCADSLKKYYRQALALGDYYLGDNERVGEWRGKAAERLGLRGRVTEETFNRLCDNLHPFEEKSLTPRTREDRSVAYDFNWHIPKSVSVLHAVTGDERIIEALRASVHDTMLEIERSALTRVRRRGEDRNRQTGNLVWAEHIHLTTRPVDGVPDPHAHVHCVVFNATYDSAEDRFKAAQFREHKRDAPYYQEVFYSRLADRLNKLGLATERSSDGWGLAGVPRSLTRKFSRRTTEIEELATRLGIVDPAQKAQLGALSRSRKDEGLGHDELRKQWMERLTSEEREVIDRVKRGGARSRDMPVTAGRALEHAIAHRFQPESVVPSKRLLESALRHGLGQVTPEQIHDAARNHPELLRARSGDQEFVTTRLVLEEERAMLRFAREGRGACPAFERGQPWNPHLHAHPHANPHAHPHPQRGLHPHTQATSLNAQQQAAVRHVLTSQDRVMLVRGGAGTGKTTLMQAAVAALQVRGVHVVPVAPSVEASRHVLRQSGFATADTIAEFLKNDRMQASAKNGLIWVDEAGLVGTRDMKRVFDVAAQLNARVLLTGDTRQHAPVQRGDALRLLEASAGLKAAEVLKVVRQQGQYREAVECMSKGRFDDGIAILDRLGAIREIEGPERPVQIARDCVDSVRKGQSCLVVAPTHAEGEVISGLVRAEMRRHGLLGQDGAIIQQLHERRMTDAERSDAARYENGQLIRFQKHAPGFRAGEVVEVVGRDKDGVRVATLDGKAKRTERSLPLDKSDRFRVFEDRPLPLAVGERLRFTGKGSTKDRKHKIENGATFTLAGFTKDGHLRLHNGWVVRRDFGQLAHAYTSTSHAAQAKTVDVVLISQSMAVAGAASAEQVYVSVSRGKYEARFYTDDRKALVQAVARLSTRMGATELIGEERRRLSADQGAARDRATLKEPPLAAHARSGTDGPSAKPAQSAAQLAARSVDQTRRADDARRGADARLIAQAQLAAHVQQLQRLRLYEHALAAQTGRLVRIRERGRAPAITVRGGRGYSRGR